MTEPQRGESTVDLNYVDKIVKRLEDVLGDCEVDLLHYYALLVLVVGVNVTEEHVHDAWATWRTTTRPTHTFLVPFDQLSAEVQALDTHYADAIRVVAKSIWEG